LAVEVLSPSDRMDRTQRKITDYLQTGVEMVWVADPEARTVTVYRPDRGPRCLGESEEITGEDILPGFRCRVRDFFVIPGKGRAGKAKPQRKPGKKKS